MAGWTSFFNQGNSGGIEHSGGGRTTPLPVADPQAQLTTGVPAAAPVAAPAPAADPLNSHLAELQKTWQTATDADGKPLAPQADPLAAQMFGFDRDKILTSAKQLDFTKGLNPELVAKAIGGDAAAFTQCLNEAVQTGFAAMTLNTGTLLNDGFSRHSKAFDAALPSRLRNHEISTRQSDDPVLSHPAVAPILLAMKATIAQQQPHMTPAQVTAAAENYISGLGTALVLKDTKVVEQKKEKEAVDWMQWAGMEQPK